MENENVEVVNGTVEAPEVVEVIEAPITEAPVEVVAEPEVQPEPEVIA